MAEPLPPVAAGQEMDSDSEDDDTQQTGKPANTMAQRRRAQKAIFELWLTSETGLQALRPKTKDARIADAADEEQSIHSLLAQQSGEIIKNPRDYQRELFERAKKENTIAVLDTGSGKTYIAVMLLRWIIDQELEDQAAGKPPRISFFLVDSITLVYQQFAFIEINLDHKVARVCGADGTDNWQKSKWTKLFSENRVIVCTAEVLHQCLAHSYIAMKQINLLIFDEAHHAKKNHSYARIIKDFYLSEDNHALRPRVFGMTASPIDAKVDVLQAASELETVLDSRIATTTDMSFDQFVKRPNEQVLRYASLPQPFETRLLQAVKARFSQIEVFRRVLATAPEIARQLGPWCADQYVINALSEKKLRQYELKVERKFHARSVNQDMKELNEQHAQLRAAVDLVEGEQKVLTTVGTQHGDLSSKVIELQTYLGFQFERQSSHRCIVFVEQRYTARLLATLFQRIGTQYMRAGFLVGGNAPEIEDDNFTYRQQALTLLRFKKGEINCLFATTVAEEGLDVPNCNLVVRFDMYRTMIQYVQSRGRARKENSKFIHMIENGNSVHQQLLSEVRYQEMAMRRFCLSLPEDRRLVGNEDSVEELLAREKSLRVYIEPLTGAKLTYGNALVYLANYVSAVTARSDEPHHPNFVVSAQGSKFIAEVLIPGKSVRSAIGRICTRKTLAKRSAAFEACIELRKKQQMDEYFMPVQKKVAPLMRNALLAVGMDSKNMYLMRTKPSVWTKGRGEMPAELWITIVDFPDGLERAHRPLALLTRTMMPDFPAFPLFLSDMGRTRVTSRQIQGSLKVDEGAVRKLSAFTFRMFRDVFSKTYEEDGTKLSYWLAPTNPSSFVSSDLDSQAALDWPLLDEILKHDKYSWTAETPHEFLVDKFIYDEWDGARKFYSIAVDPGLRPLDPVPDNTAKAKWNKNILEYSNSLYKNAREGKVWDLNQPVIEASKLLFRRNMLAVPNPKEKKLRTRAFLCPEPLSISVLPATIVASCFVWPAVIHRFESYLIALEACELVGVKCNIDVALAAVTKDSDNSGEHESEQKVNFQSGMGENYERLEFIGDTFLKTATSISTFIRNPKYNEEEMHIERMQMLSNSNLFQTATQIQLYEYIRSMSFSRRLWYPEALKMLKGKGVDKEEENAVIKHSLADKTIADVCEALIGAAFITHDRPGEAWREEHWENAIRAVTKLVGKPGHTMATWNDYRLAYEKPAYQTAEATASQRDLAEKAELEHPYRFQYPRLLRSAFIHPSDSQLDERVPSYQRLEFLGDALLDTACITHLFYRYPDKDPQWLTEHKMAMVANKFLGAVCVNIGFHKHLRQPSDILGYQIREYATELQEAKRTAGDSRDYWTTTSDPPKCLPDIVESYVGAMFIDSNFDYNVVQDFFDRHIKWYFEDMSIYDTFANNHPCTHLHNLLQTTYGCQDYRVMTKELDGLDGIELERKDIMAVVMIHNDIIAFTKGKSGRYARTRVASQAIHVIEGLAPYEFRSKFGCDCQVKRMTMQAEGSSITTPEMAPADCTI